MRVSPKKPHFFKPMLPGFKDSLKIPKSFFKYLEGQRDVGHAVLSRGGKSWKMKINGQNLEEGWKKFADDNNLHIGDFLVFRHEGNMSFEVVVFDPTYCERELPDLIQSEVETTEAIASHDSNSSNHVQGIPDEKATLEEISAARNSSLLNNHPYFSSTLKRYCIQGYAFHILRKFTIPNGLSNRHCKIIIRNQDDRPWPAELCFMGGHDCIVHGWRQFQIANNLKEGDAFKLELVENGDVPILKIYKDEKTKSN